MSRQLRCPNCGGEHGLVNPGITMLVCGYCKATVYWSADAVLKVGVQSILPEADTRLYLNATGKLLGRDFQVVGHLRYDHGRGAWDEWYLQLADGGVAWLSEDERELTLEQATRIDGAVPPAPQLRVGQGMALEGQSFTVREIGHATCVGGEGQLPFVILPGERYAYADLASVDGTRFATLEYDNAVPHAFAGQVLTHEQLRVDSEAPPSKTAAHEGKHVTCPNCRAVLPPARGKDVKTVVCEYCGAQNALEGAEARVLGVNPQGYDPAFLFTVGQAGTFLGKKYEVCGRMLYADYEGYQTREYLLFNEAEGYLWLAEENGHYVLNRPTQQAPTRDPFSLTAKQAVGAGGSTFRFYEQGVTRLIYVDGALPWLATGGDTFRYADLTAPPRMFCVETDGEEVEYFHGTYLTPAEVWTAFGQSEKAPAPTGVHAAQPFIRGPLARVLMVLGGIFGLVNLVLLVWSVTARGAVIYENTFHASQYAEESMGTPFAVGKGRVLGFQIFAPLQNSWLAVDLALVDAQDNVVAEAGGEVSYYSGVEGGESWSEGSTDTTEYIRAPAPGTYRLILKGTGGSGLSGPALGEPLTIRIHQGTILTRYFLVAFLLTFIFPLFEWLRRRMFEQRRWAPVSESDDDDDD